MNVICLVSENNLTQNFGLSLVLACIRAVIAVYFSLSFLFWSFVMWSDSGHACILVFLVSICFLRLAWIFSVCEKNSGLFLLHYLLFILEPHSLTPALVAVLLGVFIFC